jgi:hypothetical protein
MSETDGGLLPVSDELGKVKDCYTIAKSGRVNPRDMEDKALLVGIVLIITVAILFLTPFQNVTVSAEGSLRYYIHYQRSLSCGLGGIGTSYWPSNGYEGGFHLTCAAP